MGKSNVIRCSKNIINVYNIVVKPFRKNTFKQKLYLILSKSSIMFGKLAKKFCKLWISR